MLYAVMADFEVLDGRNQHNIVRQLSSDGKKKTENYG